MLLLPVKILSPSNETLGRRQTTGANDTGVEKKSGAERGGRGVEKKRISTPGIGAYARRRGPGVGTHTS